MNKNIKHALYKIRANMSYLDGPDTLYMNNISIYVLKGQQLTPDQYKTIHNIYNKVNRHIMTTKAKYG